MIQLHVETGITFVDLLGNLTVILLTYQGSRKKSVWFTTLIHYLLLSILKKQSRRGYAPMPASQKHILIE